jgi:hypothetical protein
MELELLYLKSKMAGKFVAMIQEGVALPTYINDVDAPIIRYRGNLKYYRRFALSLRNSLDAL